VEKNPLRKKGCGKENGANAGKNPMSRWRATRKVGQPFLKSGRKARKLQKSRTGAKCREEAEEPSVNFAKGMKATTRLARKTVKMKEHTRVNRK